MCQIQPLHSYNSSDSLREYQVGERKLCSHPFTASDQSIPQIDLKWGQSPAEHSAQGACPSAGEHAAMQTHLQQDEQLYQPDTHTGFSSQPGEFAWAQLSTLSTHARP